MSEQRIAEWYVQYSSKGLDLIAAEMGKVSVSLGGLAADAGKAGAAMAAVGTQAAAQMQQAGASVQDLKKHFGMLDATNIEVFARLRKELAGGWDISELRRTGASVEALAKHFGMLDAAPIDIFKRLKEEYAALARTLASGSLEQRLEALASIKALRGLGEGINAGPMAGLSIAAQGTGEPIQRLSQAIAPMTMRLWGFVTAGVAASSTGQILGYRFQELSRQIGSLFVPQINWVVSKLTDLVRWFQRLSGEQQANLRFWGLTAGGIVGVALVLPRVIASVQALGMAFTGLKAIMIGLSAANPLLLVAAAIAAVIVATSDWKDIMQSLKLVGDAIADPFKAVLETVREVIAAIKELRGVKDGGTKDVLTEANEYGGRHLARRRMIMEGESRAAEAGGGPDWFKSLRKLLGQTSADTKAMVAGWVGFEAASRPGDQKRNELAPKLGGFEDVEATYRRIALASRLVGGDGDKTTEEKILEGINRSAGTIDEIKKEIERFKLPLRP